MKGTEPIREATRQIDRLVRQIQQASSTQISEEDFYKTVLGEGAMLLRARAAALWTSARWQITRMHDPDQLLASFSADELAREARRLAQLNHRTATHMAFDLHGQFAGLTALAGPCRLRDGTAGVLVYYTPCGLPPDSQAGCLRFVAAVAEEVTRYEQSHSEHTGSAAMWSWKLHDDFVRAVHRPMPLLETAYVAANEARRLLACDRTFLLLRRRGRYRAVACSSVDAIDTHSRLAKRLARLVEALAPVAEPWSNDGDMSSVEPEIQAPLEAYLDESTVRRVAVIPLRGGPEETKRPIGMLVLENLTARPLPQYGPAVASLAEHAGEALAGSAQRNTWPVRAALAATHPWTVWKRNGRIPRWLTAITVLALLLGYVLTIPINFNIRASGRLVPLDHQRVFAPHHGFLDEIHVTHGQAVTADQLIARISSPELDLELQRLIGELRTTQEQLASTSAERFQVTGVDASSVQRAGQLTAEELALRQREASLQAQLELVQQEVAQLQLTSPMAGTVLDWNIEQRLAGRPIKRGQLLIEIADLSGPWALQLEVPDRRAGHVREARHRLQKDLPVSFVVSQQPERTHHGVLGQADLVTHSGQQQNAHVRMEVTFNQDELTDPRPGATVVAKIHCGQRSLGYVWFHEIYEQLRRVLF